MTVSTFHLPPFALPTILVALLAATGCDSTERNIRDLQSGNPRRQLKAVERFRQKPNPRLIPALRDTLDAPDARVRRACAEAIATTADREARRDAAASVSRDALLSDQSVAKPALETLGRLGSVALPEFVTVATLIEDPALRETALTKMLTTLKTAEAQDRLRAARILSDALAETDPALYDASFETLLVLVLPLLRELEQEGLAHPDSRVRRAIVNALGRFRNPEVVGPLERLASSDPDYSVRAAAHESLARLAGE